MKRTYFLAILFFLTIAFPAAQAQVQFGLGAGINLGKLHKTADVGYITNERVANLSLRGFFDFSINERLSLQPEFNFIQKGFKRFLEDRGNPIYPNGIDRIYQYNYLNLNFLVKYYFMDKSFIYKRNNRDGFNLNGYVTGGFFGGGAGSKKYIDLTTDDKEPIITSDFIFSGLIDGNFGALGGVGCLFSKDFFSIFAEFRYSHDILRLNEHLYRSEKLKNSNLILETGVQFRMSR